MNAAVVPVASGAETLPTMQFSALASSEPTAPGSFDSLVRSLQDLNTQMTVNQHSVQALASGESGELHRVMMNLETTKLAFDFALQVRNKVLDAYQEMMRMQV